ncbi:MAG: helix-turn-helix transcriptional regulator, partial [Gemmatimonadota bacterium]
MSPKSYLGEFEQMVLLAILQRGEHANGYEVRRELEVSAGRVVSKGAFYTTLDRLERKGYVTWEARVPQGDGSSLPQRHFRVTTAGLEELRRSR